MKLKTFKQRKDVWPALSDNYKGIKIRNLTIEGTRKVKFFSLEKAKRYIDMVEKKEIDNIIFFDWNY